MPVDRNGEPYMAHSTRHDLLTLRMCGDNVTMYRTAWFELLYELRVGSSLRARVRAMLCEPTTTWHCPADGSRCQCSAIRAAKCRDRSAAIAALGTGCC